MPGGGHGGWRWRPPRQAPTLHKRAPGRAHRRRELLPRSSRGLGWRHPPIQECLPHSLQCQQLHHLHVQQYWRRACCLADGKLPYPYHLEGGTLANGSILPTEPYGNPMDADAKLITRDPMDLYAKPVARRLSIPLHHLLQRLPYQKGGHHGVLRLVSSLLFFFPPICVYHWTLTYSLTMCKL